MIPRKPVKPDLSDEKEEKKEAAPAQPVKKPAQVSFTEAAADMIDDPKQLAQLVGVNKTFNAGFQKKANKKRDALLKQLLTHVIRGEQEEADQLLQKFRGLLRLSGQVEGYSLQKYGEEYSGQKYEGTALRLALGAKDVEMAEMIKKHMLLLDGGEEEMRAQIKAQFPEGEEKAWEARQEEDEQALLAVVKAIGEANREEDCADAIQAFRDYLDAPRGDADGVQRTGFHWNDALLLRAFELYNKNYDDFGRWDSLKNNLCWRQVIGTIQRHMPANYAQAFVQGIWDIVEDHEPLKRSLTIRFSARESFYPLDLHPAFRLGFAYAVDEFASAVRRRGVGLVLRRAAASGRVLFRNFCQAKTDGLQQFMRPRPDPAQTCVIL